MGPCSAVGNYQTSWLPCKENVQHMLWTQMWSLKGTEIVDFHWIPQTSDCTPLRFKSFGAFTAKAKCSFFQCISFFNTQVGWSSGWNKILVLELISQTKDHVSLEPKVLLSLYFHRKHYLLQLKCVSEVGDLFWCWLLILKGIFCF